MTRQRKQVNYHRHGMDGTHIQRQAASMGDSSWDEESPMPPREVHCIQCDTVFYPDLQEGIVTNAWDMFCSEACEVVYKRMTR